MSDEEVIKRRLLIDGDGTGDDRRLNVLLKTFIKWCNSGDVDDNSKVINDRMLAQIAQCELAVTKSDLSAKMMKHELTNYEAISQTIEIGIEHAKTEIDHSKENLILAKKIRKNRMEYDVLAKVISQQPDRKDTVKKLELLWKELAELENQKHMVEKKLESRRKEFTVLMRSIKELQSKLGETVEENNLDELMEDNFYNSMNKSPCYNTPKSSYYQTDEKNSTSLRTLDFIYSP